MWKIIRVIAIVILLLVWVALNEANVSRLEFENQEQHDLIRDLKKEKSALELTIQTTNRTLNAATQAEANTQVKLERTKAELERAIEARNENRDTATELRSELQALKEAGGVAQVPDRIQSFYDGMRGGCIITMVEVGQIEPAKATLACNEFTNQWLSVDLFHKAYLPEAERRYGEEKIDPTKPTS